MSANKGVLVTAGRWFSKLWGTGLRARCRKKMLPSAVLDREAALLAGTALKKNVTVAAQEERTADRLLCC